MAENFSLDGDNLYMDVEVTTEVKFDLEVALQEVIEDSGDLTNLLRNVSDDTLDAFARNQLSGEFQEFTAEGVVAYCENNADDIIDEACDEGLIAFIQRAIERNDWDPGNIFTTETLEQWAKDNLDLSTKPVDNTEFKPLFIDLRCATVAQRHLAVDALQSLGYDLETNIDHAATLKARRDILFVYLEAPGKTHWCFTQEHFDADLSKAQARGVDVLTPSDVYRMAKGIEPEPIPEHKYGPIVDYATLRETAKEGDVFECTSCDGFTFWTEGKHYKIAYTISEASAHPMLGFPDDDPDPRNRSCVAPEVKFRQVLNAGDK